jgi:tRNA threonylcarbamoyladenosine biosynthesis protein TsaE
MTSVRGMVVCATEAETLALGERIGTLVQAGDLILLSGELGAGKTVLVRGIATGMGIDPATVRSPTFVLHHVYRAGPRVLHHIDLYRLGPNADIRLLDIDEMLESGGVVVVEWGEHGDLAPGAQVSFSFEIREDGSRLIQSRAGAPDRLTLAFDAAGPS